jgi:hypothetical protein
MSYIFDTNNALVNQVLMTEEFAVDLDQSVLGKAYCPCWWEVPFKNTLG